MSAARQTRPAPASECRCDCHRDPRIRHQLDCCSPCIDCGRMTALERCYSCALRNPHARGIGYKAWWPRYGHTWASPAAAAPAQKPKFGGTKA